MPPHMAGRENETKEFQRLLEQEIILKNLVLTGLRGLGKTVLLETFKPMAIEAGWLWAGADLSESTSISEEHLATRILIDLSVATSAVVYGQKEKEKAGFASTAEQIKLTLDYPTLKSLYDKTPGLVADKLKGVLETVWDILRVSHRRGVVFAYDEAQNLADHAEKDQYPLSLLLDLFQSLQRKGCGFMLALAGLPMLFPKLVEARTFAERMFKTITLGPLDERETAEAVQKPIENDRCPVEFKPESVETIWHVTRGYPYFVQYVCREIFDIWVQAMEAGLDLPIVPVQGIMRKLDSDFFAGRWGRATDRQRSLLWLISLLPNCDAEFTVQEIVEHRANTHEASSKAFSASSVNQMLVSLGDAGLVYKNRHGKYSFAVPLLGEFIRRETEEPD